MLWALTSKTIFAANGHVVRGAEGAEGRLPVPGAVWLFIFALALDLLLDLLL